MTDPSDSYFALRPQDVTLNSLVHACLTTSHRLITATARDGDFELLHSLVHDISEVYGVFPMYELLAAQATFLLAALPLPHPVIFSELTFSKVQGFWTWTMGPTTNLDDADYRALNVVGRLLCVYANNIRDIQTLIEERLEAGIVTVPAPDELPESAVADTENWIAEIRALPAESHCRTLRSFFSIAAGLGLAHAQVHS